MVRNFYNLEVWNLGYELTLELYKLTENFPEHERGNVISQIRRAALSIPLNIAEGSTRNSKKAYLQFLQYAYGSARELEVLISISKDLKYITEEDFNLFYEEIDKLSKKLFVFIKKINNYEFFSWYDK